MRSFARRLIYPLVATLLVGACASSEQRAADEDKLVKRVEIHTQLGASYLYRNQLDIAQQELEKALSIDPSDSQANNIMALLQARMRNDDKADSYFRKAISEKPDNSEALNNYGVFLCERGRLADAERRFQEALKNPLYKTPEIANVNAGLCLLKKPDPVAAAAYFKAALRINPKSPLALYHMARITFDSGQTLSARGFMQRHMEVAKDSPEGLLLAYKIERALGAKDTQASYAVRLRGKFPDSPEAKQLREIVGR